MITLTLYLGIPILRARDPAESVDLMRYAARQGQRLARGNLHRKSRRATGKKRLQSHVLQGFPGIGPERANALLAYFGTVESILTADEETLANVPGIGINTARAIRWVAG